MPGAVTETESEKGGTGVWMTMAATHPSLPFPTPFPSLRQAITPSGVTHLSPFRPLRPSSTRCCHQHPMLPSAPDVAVNTRCCRQHQILLSAPDSHRSSRQPQSPPHLPHRIVATITGSQPPVLLSSEDFVFCRHHPQRQTSSVLPYRNIPWLRLSHPGLQSVGVLRPPPALHCGLHYAVRAYITQG